MLARQGRFAEARKRYEHCIELRPDFAEAHANLGALLLDHDEPAAAIDELRAALHFDPGLGAAAFNLGDALARLDRGEEASAAYRDAARIAGIDTRIGIEARRRALELELERSRGSAAR